MILTEENLQYLYTKAKEAAYKAGTLINEYATKDIEVHIKEGGTSISSQVVTEVDAKSQATIISVLQSTADEFNIAILAEEEEDDKQRLTKDYFWCIDPLDGTLFFTEKKHGYSVSIGLVDKDGISHIGIIYDPVKDIMYHAIKGKGAFKNDNPLILTEPENPTEVKIYSDRSFLSESEYPLFLNSISEFAKKEYSAPMVPLCLGGAAMHASWMIETAPACYVKLPRKTKGGGSLWDFAASSCICIEAGCIVTDIFGNRLDLNRTDSTFMNHRGVLYCTNKALLSAIIDFYKNLDII